MVFSSYIYSARYVLLTMLELQAELYIRHIYIDNNIRAGQDLYTISGGGKR
jgi:hypothetical protein